MFGGGVNMRETQIYIKTEKNRKIALSRGVSPDFKFYVKSN